jgi:small subunit ribosomal protein S7
MSRRKKAEYIRDIGVDSRFQSLVIQKLINVLMERGKKELSRSIVYGAFDVINQKTHGDDKKSFEVFNKAFSQVVPYVEVRPRRVGGSVYQVPMEVNEKRRRSLALRWLIDAAQQRPGKNMIQRLSSEIMDAAEGHGGAVKKRSGVQKMAEANRAFSHYAW